MSGDGADATGVFHFVKTFCEARLRGGGMSRTLMRERRSEERVSRRGLRLVRYALVCTPFSLKKLHDPPQEHSKSGDHRPR